MQLEVAGTMVQFLMFADDLVLVAEKEKEC